GEARSRAEGGKREPFHGDGRHWKEGRQSWAAASPPVSFLRHRCCGAGAAAGVTCRSGGGRWRPQIGRGALQPAPQRGPAFVREVFRFKESLAEDLRSADLVISHAGAGSCLETLEEGKPLLVVINEKLMDNHQLELARQLHKDGHVLYCNCSTLVETLQSMDLSTLKPFPPGQPEKFALFLDKVAGFE
uniref:UDP-N-acetylglucosamine transferase subunit ALG13 n=1 Tax=Chrysolophus pictus TaxID=9089 RepID=A0A8C3L2B4_CHRPC